MKNCFKLNKKGFTLVELLAVIVILALLIVITANTLLPLMKNTESSGMTIYAEKMMQNALTMLESDKILTTIEYPKEYSISSNLTDGKDDYVGCVQITSSGNTIYYDIKMYDLKNGKYLYTLSRIEARDLEDATKYKVIDYKGSIEASEGVAKIETKCDNNFADLSEETTS